MRFLRTVKMSARTSLLLSETIRNRRDAMSRLWLKMVGTTESPCPESYVRDHVDFVRNPRRVCPGDHLVFYAVGGKKRIFAIASVESAPYESGQKRWPYRVKVAYLMNLPVSAGVHLDEVSTSRRDLLRSVGRQSYIELRPEEYTRAARRLQQRLPRKR